LTGKPQNKSQTYAVLMRVAFSAPSMPLAASKEQAEKHGLCTQQRNEKKLGLML